MMVTQCNLVIYIEDILITLQSMDFLFYLFSSFALISGIMVIQAKNPVHSVLFLILVFFNSAGQLIMLSLDFFAMIFLVVYVGAIAVLFLFVVMMLNIKVAEINEKKLRYLPIGGLLAFLFLLEIFVIVDNDLIPVFQLNSVTPFTQWAFMKESLNNISALGNIIYTYYFYFFCMASLILLVAMIGAIVLTMHKKVTHKRQLVFHQNCREFAKTVAKIN